MGSTQGSDACRLNQPSSLSMSRKSLGSVKCETTPTVVQHFGVDVAGAARWVCAGWHHAKGGGHSIIRSQQHQGGDSGSVLGEVVIICSTFVRFSSQSKHP